MDILKQAMQKAIQLSLEKMLAGEGGPFGAVIVKGRDIIAEGWNQVLRDNDPTAHAEVVAIRQACRALSTFDLKGCILLTSCEPCPMCLATSLWARIDKIYYANTRYDAAGIGFDDSFFYEEFLKPVEERSIPMIPLLREEGQKAFQAWSLKHDRTMY